MLSLNITTDCPLHSLSACKISVGSTHGSYVDSYSSLAAIYTRTMWKNALTSLPKCSAGGNVLYISFQFSCSQERLCLRQNSLWVTCVGEHRWVFCSFYVTKKYTNAAQILLSKKVPGICACNPQFKKGQYLSCFSALSLDTLKLKIVL